MHTCIYMCISLVFARYFWTQLLLGSQFAACQTISDTSAVWIGKAVGYHWAPCAASVFPVGEV